MEKENCVWEAIQFFYFIGRFYGMTTFTYDRNNLKTIHVTITDALLLIGFLTFYISLLLLNFNNHIEFLDSGFIIFNTGIRYLLLYAITMVIFSVCFNFLFRTKLWNIILNVISVDQAVSHILLQCK